MSRQSGVLPLSDLIQTSRLDASFSSPYTIHDISEHDETGHRVIRKEYWKREKTLGRGGFGEVRLERNNNSNQLRAVKKLLKRANPNDIDHSRELEAILEFSHQAVSVVP